MMPIMLCQIIIRNYDQTTVFFVTANSIKTRQKMLCAIKEMLIHFVDFAFEFSRDFKNG